MLKKLLETDAEQQMAEYLGLRWHERAQPAERVDYRNGFYERDYVTPLGIIRLRIPRTRQRSFLPRCIGRLERRAPEVAELIRQAFLRGISTRQVGRVAAVLTGEAVSAQTVSRLTRVLDHGVRTFHQRPLGDEWAYVVLDGVWLKVRRACGPQRVLLLVAYGIRRDGRRELLAFTRAKSESQAGWEGLLNDLYQRGLRGQNLQLVITDGCPGLARWKRCIRACATNAAGCTRCGIFCRKCGGGTKSRSKPRRRRFIWQRMSQRRGGPSSASAFTGAPATRRWSGNWSATSRSCCTSLPFRDPCGGNCAPPT
jgi:transposase-like protein